MKKGILILTLALFIQPSFSNDIMEDFDSLGGNKILFDKASELKPDMKVQAVQNRIINRIKRHEFHSDISSVIGGEAYLNSGHVGFGYQYHINPRWSVGAKYSYQMNELNKEGQALLDLSTGQAEELKIGLIPDINWVKQSYMAIVNWYPFYGKVNVFEKSIVHFDVYGLFGAGQVDLRRGTSPTITAGLGIGLWISQHLTGRIEYRYQTYKSESLLLKRDMHISQASFSVGYML